MKHSSSQEGNNDKLEQSKVRQDLKEVTDRQGTVTFTRDAGAAGDGKRNPLQEFFVDEIIFTIKLLNDVRTDMDETSFDDSEVRRIDFSRSRTTIHTIFGL